LTEEKEPYAPFSLWSAVHRPLISYRVDREVARCTLTFMRKEIHCAVQRCTVAEIERSAKL